jgi:GR25 family glycosyltransferase involved in LPS biosynthesis
MLVFVINRDDRPDRLASVTREIDSIGINARRMPAIEGGWKGCKLSHLAILRGLELFEEALILEDDVHFLDTSAMELIERAKEELQDDWDCLYLGGSPQEPQERYSDHIFKAKGVITTHAILWNFRQDGAVQYIQDEEYISGKIDKYFAEVIQPLFNCFMIYPMLATQHAGKSDIARHSDVSTIATNFKRYCI